MGRRGRIPVARCPDPRGAGAGRGDQPRFPPRSRSRLSNEKGTPVSADLAPAARLEFGLASAIPPTKKPSRGGLSCFKGSLALTHFRAVYLTLSSALHAIRALTLIHEGDIRMSTIRIGDLEVNRLGFGAMRVIDNDEIWGEPTDRAHAIKVLRRAVELGVNFFDTAESYGPH